jgi:AcrR family transcriptional regulator
LEQEQDSRTERKKKEARERILAAAEQLFIVEHSYETTTIRQIAKKADVGLGSVYNHFKTKAHILTELVKRHAKRIEQQMAQSIPGHLTGAGKIGVLLSFLNDLRNDPFIQLLGSRPIISEVDRVHIKLDQEDVLLGFQRIIADILISGAADGTLRTVADPKLTASILMQLTTSFILDIAIGGPILSFVSPPPVYDVDAAYASYCDLMQNSLCAQLPAPSWKSEK